MNAPSQSSSNPAGAAPVAPVKKPRSPIERTLVWGGIAALLAVTLLELRAQQGYARTLEALGNRLDEDDEDVTLEQAKPLLAFSPALSEPVPAIGANEIKCSWFSLFKKGQYEITLIISKEKEPVLLSFKTAALPEEPEEDVTPPANNSGSSPSPAMGMGGGAPGMGGGMGGGFGGMGGAPRPNPLRDAIDGNADGELSTEEIAAAPNSLGKLDKDTDGQIVAAELAPPPTEGATGTPSAPGGQGAGTPAGGGGGGPRPPGRLLESIDTNGDGTISAEERAAAVDGLKKLDANGDGKIVRDELRPPGGFGGGGFGPPGGGGGTGRRRPDTEEAPPAAATPDKPAEGTTPAEPAPEKDSAAEKAP